MLSILFFHLGWSIVWLSLEFSLSGNQNQKCNKQTLQYIHTNACNMGYSEINMQGNSYIFSKEKKIHSVLLFSNKSHKFESVWLKHLAHQLMYTDFFSFLTLQQDSLLLELHPRESDIYISLFKYGLSYQFFPLSLTMFLRCVFNKHLLGRDYEVWLCYWKPLWCI